MRLVVKQQHSGANWRGDGYVTQSVALIDTAIAIAKKFSLESKMQGTVVDETLKGPVLRGIARDGMWLWAKRCARASCGPDFFCGRCEVGFTLG